MSVSLKAILFKDLCSNLSGPLKQVHAVPHAGHLTLGYLGLGELTYTRGEAGIMSV